MIFLDVTSAAASPVNMGVQRTVRGIFSWLKGRTELEPLRWDFHRKRYARLSGRERDFLDRPFASYADRAEMPSGWQWRDLLAAWRDARTRPARLVDDGEILGPGAVLLIPDLCWDRRTKAWARFAGRPGKKVALFHDAMPLRIRGQSDSDEKLFASYVRALADLDLVICVSEEVERDLLGYWQEFGVRPKPTRVLPWPVPFTQERPDHAPHQGARRVLYVSRLKLRKNHLVLLEACEQLWSEGRSFDLELIGIRDTFSDTRKILRQVRALTARGRPIVWRHHVSDSDLAEAYRACSFTAFPSRMEGFGLPIIESLWHARPVICGRNGAIGEVARHGGCHQVDQNCPRELATAIDLLLSDRTAYERLYAETRARTFRSWKEYGRDLQAVLHDLAP